MAKQSARYLGWFSEAILHGQSYNKVSKTYINLVRWKKLSQVLQTLYWSCPIKKVNCVLKMNELWENLIFFDYISVWFYKFFDEFSGEFSFQEILEIFRKMVKIVLMWFIRSFRFLTNLKSSKLYQCKRHPYFQSYLRHHYPQQFGYQ